MKPRINFIILGVDDLDRSIDFYSNGMGLPTEGMMGDDLKDELTGAYGTIAFFHLDNGLMLGVYERANLAKDANVQSSSRSLTELSLGYAVNSKDEVGVILEKAKTAGAILTDKPHQRPWGVYSGYFQDLDGHLWEVTYDPRIKLAEG